MSTHVPRRLAGIRPYLMLLPMLIFSVAFVYYPFLTTAADSFSIVNARGEITGFAGLSQYQYLFGRREFRIALENTLKLTLINVPLTLVLTLSLAWLSQKPGRLSPVLESIFSLPMVIAMSSVTLIFKVMLEPTVGIANQALGLKLGWYEDKSTALLSILTVTVWMGIGLNYLLFLSALRSVPAAMTEAAQLDGATKPLILFRIQLPLIAPTILYMVCTNMILAMMTNGPVMILTQGGPSRATTTLIYLMYTTGYSSSNYSMAGCISLVTFALTMLFTFALFRREQRQVSF